MKSVVRIGANGKGKDLDEAATGDRPQIDARAEVRRKAGKKPTLGVGILDSQSVKTAEKAGGCGYDAGKIVERLRDTAGMQRMHDRDSHDKLDGSSPTPRITSLLNSDLPTERAHGRMAPFISIRNWSLSRGSRR